MGTIGTRSLMIVTGEKTGQREEDKGFPLIDTLK